VPPSFRPRCTASGDSTARELPGRSKVHLACNDKTQISHDLESQCGAFGRKQQRARTSKRPTKDQRAHYRQLVADLEAEMTMDPTRFDLSRVQLPDEVHTDSKTRMFLFERLRKRLETLQSELLQSSGLQGDRRQVGDHSRLCGYMLIPCPVISTDLSHFLQQ